MPNHPKRPRDPAQLAKFVVDMATGQIPHDPPIVESDPRAVETGRRGGLAGGAARAKALPPKKRTEIAKQGAAARWKKRA